MIFRRNAFSWAVLSCLVMLFVACKDEDTVTGTGELRIELSDAPFDDGQIQGVFVTVSEVYVDGKLWAGFDTKQTIDLRAFQGGDTYLLGFADVDGKSYSKISLVLDLDENASGTSPGCYVLTKDGTKHDLATTTASEMTITVNGPDFKVLNEQSTTVVIDVDLRKALRYGNPNVPASNYAFVTNVQNATRLIEKERSAEIRGHIQDLVTNSELVVAYVYKKGTFNRTEEVDQPDDQQFAHAYTSAAVDVMGDYRLTFLENGEYELVFGSYVDEASNGTMNLQGTLNMESSLGLDLKAISVGVASTVTVDATVLGLLPI